MLKNRNAVFTLALLLLLCLSAGPALAVTKTFRKSEPKQGSQVERAVEDGLEQRFEPSELDNPLAVIKEGFFAGVTETHITLKNMKTYRSTTYRLDENYQVFYQGEIIGFDNVPPSSIVQLVMVGGLIKEVILLQRSS